MLSSRLVPGRCPAVGVSPIADRIRERRGARGLSPLDTTLLHVPPIADGWNSLLGAIRSKGNLPGDIRELMILRVAAINKAVFEWVQHEIVGRSAGLVTAQLAIVRDISSLPTSPGVLSAFQIAALAYADESTRNVIISSPVTDTLKAQLALSLPPDAESKENQVQDLLVESAAVVATYNMVSRFLVSLDVAGFSGEAVPWPADTTVHNVPLPDSPEHYIHAITHVTSLSAPWLVFCNSLLTTTSMWNAVLPYTLARTSSPYNVLLHDQRGHGLSSSPASGCTIPVLAKDIAVLIDHFKITQAHSVIGVSQGGATALSFAAQFPDRTASIIACDTGPRTAPGNKEAWQDRIALATSQGMEALANVTVPRWFAQGSKCYPGTPDSGIDPATAGEKFNRTGGILKGIQDITVDGFALGAGALMDYDLIGGSEPSLLKSEVKTLLVAGSLDGGGKVAAGMHKLQADWASHEKANVEFVEIQGAGHLPMVDETEEFWRVIEPFLRGST